MSERGKYCSGFDALPMTRREMLQKSSTGFGALALAGLLGEEAKAVSPENPLAQRAPHFPAKAKRIIFLFMHGGVSQVDTFDYRPALQRDTGKPYPGKKPRIVSSATGNLVASPYSFKQYGRTRARARGTRAEGSPCCVYSRSVYVLIARPTLAMGFECC